MQLNRCNYNVFAKTMYPIIQKAHVLHCIFGMLMINLEFR